MVIMAKPNISAIFLRDNAAKHFLAMTYWARDPSQPESVRRLYHSSCFVVEIDGYWLLLTAGHVINGIKEAMKRGVVHDTFELQDQSAGHAFGSGVPYPFHANDWAVLEIEARGMDYAVALLPELVMQALKAGGVRPITESVWGTASPDQMDDWLLIGIPSETLRSEGTTYTLKLTLIPLVPTEAPSQQAEGRAENKLYATLRTQPGIDGAIVHDIGGMSGGPIFGVKTVNGELRYWVIGIQSGWYQGSRIASFCPLVGFMLTLQAHIRREMKGKRRGE